MASGDGFTLRILGPGDLAAMNGMLTMFGIAFEDRPTYDDARPDDAYLQRLLGSDTFVAIAAMKGDEVVGGLAAYELRKFEQARSEFYLYDLAVAEAHRREASPPR